MMQYNTDNIINMVLTSLKNLHRKEVLQHKQQMSKGAFYNEFQRIIIGVPRRTGKTSAAYELLKHVPNSILIKGLRNSSVPDDYMFENKNVMHAYEITKDIFRGRILDLIIIDNARFLKPKYMNILLESTEHHLPLFVEIV